MMSLIVGGGDFFAYNLDVIYVLHLTNWSVLNTPSVDMYLS